MAHGHVVIFEEIYNSNLDHAALYNNNNMDPRIALLDVTALNYRLVITEYALGGILNSYILYMWSSTS